MSVRCVKVGITKNKNGFNIIIVEITVYERHMKYIQPYTYPTYMNHFRHFVLIRKMAFLLFIYNMKTLTLK